MNKTSKRVAIIDGDTLCYRAAAATDKRSVSITHLPSGKSKIFKTRTEFKDSLKAKNFEYIAEDYVFVDRQEAEPEAHAFNLVNSQLAKIEAALEPDEIRIYIASGDNFRNFLPFPSPYKNRAETARPINLLATRNYAIAHHEAIDVSASFLETDDVIIIEAYAEQAKGNDVYLLTQDKDSNQSDGIKLYNWTVENPEVKLMPLIGEIYKDHNNAMKGSGLKFLCGQWLVGDRTDNLCSYELSKVKYGLTKAIKALEPCKTLQEMYDVVVAEYQRLYPEPFEYTTWNGNVVQSDYRGMMDLYWQGVYMKRSWDDPSNYHLFWQSKGVNT